MQSEEELAELRGWKREDVWTRTVVHSPRGCGQRIVISPEDLILLEKLRDPAEVPQRHATQT